MSRTQTQHSPATTSQEKGRVIARFGQALVTQSTDGKQQFRCQTEKKFSHLVCGDWVKWRSEGDAHYITEALPRSNLLSRSGFRGRSLNIAANIDQLVLVISWHPEPDWMMVDRFLMSAHAMGAEVSVVANKQDLLDPIRHQVHLQQLELLQAHGINVIHCSLEQPQCINELNQQLRDKTSILLGLSGVGKTSLTERLIGQPLKTQQTSDNGEGRHTTSASWLYPLAEGGFLIDSPGVRDFIPEQFSEQDVAHAYPDIVEASSACKFNNCEHIKEPQCAVQTAVEAQQIDTKRYKRYAQNLQNAKLAEIPSY